MSLSTWAGTSLRGSFSNRSHTDWPAFRRYFARIRKDGCYVSNGELESSLGAVAAPLVPADGRVVGAISLVAPVERLALADMDKLSQLIRRAAGEISARIGAV